MDALGAEDPRRVGLFVLVGRLGAGGMGQVYLGRAADGRLAAVKVVHEAYALDSSFRARFAREVRTARQVQAHWVVPVLDADSEAARPWLATEYVPGPSLEDAVAADGRLSEQTLAVLAAGLAHALVELRGLGVVHRDVKPANVLIAADGPRLIDFGIARARDATRITRTGFAVGTPAYMSPEQANGELETEVSDIFSLASVLALAASAQHPFGAATNPMAVLLRVVRDEPELGSVPAWLRGELTGCLDKNPDVRPTAAELVGRFAPMAAARGAWPPRLSRCPAPPTIPAALLAPWAPQPALFASTDVYLAAGSVGPGPMAQCRATASVAVGCGGGYVADRCSAARAWPGLRCQPERPQAELPAVLAQPKLYPVAWQSGESVGIPTRTEPLLVSTGTEVKMVDPDSYAVLDSLQLGTPVWKVDRSSDNTTIYAQTEPGEITPVDLRSRQRGAPMVFSSLIRTFRISEDNRRMVVLTDDHQLSVIDLATGARRWHSGPTRPASSLSTTPVTVPT